MQYVKVDYLHHDSFDGFYNNFRQVIQDAKDDFVEAFVNDKNDFTIVVANYVEEVDSEESDNEDKKNDDKEVIDSMTKLLLNTMTEENKESIIDEALKSDNPKLSLLDLLKED